MNWEQYVEENADKSLVFSGRKARNEGEIMVAPYAHRFRQEYTEMQYAKIQSFIRGALREYDDPYLVFLTFSATTLKPNGEPRSPLDHMDEVVESWGNGVYYELNRVMEGDRKRDPWEPRPEWEYLYILEPTTNEGYVPGGYAHAHAGVVVDGAVEAARFESVIRRHLTECPGARGEAHEFEDAIEVKSAAELNNPGAYLFKYLGKSWDVEEMEDYERRFAALLFDQGRQRFRASNGSQRWMERDEEESEVSRWRFEGVARGEQACELREYGDVETLREETGVVTVNEWITGVPSLSSIVREREADLTATEENLVASGLLERHEFEDSRVRPPPYGPAIVGDGTRGENDPPMNHD